MTAAVDPLGVPGFEPGPDLIPAEQAVVGAVICSRRAAEEVGPLLGAEHFYRPAHGVIYAAAQRLTEDGVKVDPVAVLSELTRTGDLLRCGGGPYLHTLQAAASVTNVERHVRRVRADHTRRAFAALGASASAIAADPAFTPDAAAEHVRRMLEDATAEPASGGLPTQAEVVDEVLADLETDPEPGLPTGFADLTDAITGLFPGELVIIGGRPGQGKSILGYGLATHVGVKLGLPVLFTSLEMSRHQLTQRLIAAEAKVPLPRIRQHALEDDDWLRIRNAHDRMTSSKVLIDDTPTVSLAHIRARLRGMARTGPARLLVVDYLGLLAEPKGAENRQAAVAGLCRGLKLIAREYGIPVVALAQLNRNAETRHDRRPQLADLRESGAQEQDADIVLLLHREDAYDRESPRAGEVDVIVAKQRQGPQCTVTLAFQGHYARMVDLAGEWTPTRVLGGAVA